MNMCASVPVSWRMCLHVWEWVRDFGPLPFIWDSRDGNQEPVPDCPNHLTTASKLMNFLSSSCALWSLEVRLMAVERLRTWDTYSFFKTLSILCIDSEMIKQWRQGWNLAHVYFTSSQEWVGYSIKHTAFLMSGISLWYSSLPVWCYMSTWTCTSDYVSADKCGSYLRL